MLLHYISCIMFVIYYMLYNTMNYWGGGLSGWLCALDLNL